MIQKLLKVLFLHMFGLLRYLMIKALTPLIILLYLLWVSAFKRNQRRKRLAPVCLCYASNIHKQSRAESWEDATVHPSPRGMVVSSPTVVWNHTQSL